MAKADYALRLSTFLRWYIVNAADENLAWSGSRWVAHVDGLPASPVQVCNFSSEAEADSYAQEVLA